MTVTDALERLATNLADAQERYAPIRDRGESLRLLGDFLSQAGAEHNAGDDATVETRFAERIAQLGALCLRSLVDLAAVDEPRTIPCPHCGK